MARKQADIATELNTCLDWIQTGQETLESALAHFPDQADELRPMLETAVWMQSMAEMFDPDRQRLAISKRRLVARIKQEQAAPQTKGLRGWLEKLFKSRNFVFQAALSLLLVLALTFGSIGVAQASQGTIPGDSLYGVKLTLEDAELAFSLDPLQDARLHLKFIQRRVFEIQALVLENRLEFLSQTVTRYQQQVDKAVQSLKLAAQRLPAQSIQLANELQGILIEQAPLFAILSEAIPADYQAELTRLQVITNDGISASREVIDASENVSRTTATLLPSPTSGLNPSNTPALMETATPTGTGLPLFLATEDVSIDPSSTPTPTIITMDGENDDDDGIIPTRKPTKTPRPTKTSKPTKTPKIKI